MSVRRAVRGMPAAFTWWVDDVIMTEGEKYAQGTLGPNPAQTAQQFYGMYVFDELIQTRARNQGKALWTSDWQLWLIDHTRAFRPDVEITNPGRLVRIGRDLIEGLRCLTQEALDAALDRVLDRPLRSAVLERRDLLVAHFDARIATRGEAAVVIDPRGAGPSSAERRPLGFAARRCSARGFAPEMDDDAPRSHFPRSPARHQWYTFSPRVRW